MTILKNITVHFDYSWHQDPRLKKTVGPAARTGATPAASVESVSLRRRSAGPDWKQSAKGRTCVYTSRSSFETFKWLCVHISAKLHAHYDKHLLNVKFSYREHWWLLTSRTCVNKLINETNVKYEAISVYQSEILLFI